jgi:hypothetical protein
MNNEEGMLHSKQQSKMPSWIWLATCFESDSLIKTENPKPHSLLLIPSLHTIRSIDNTFLSKLTSIIRQIKAGWCTLFRYMLNEVMVTERLPIILCGSQKHLITRFTHKNLTLLTEYSPPKSDGMLHNYNFHIKAFRLQYGMFY